MQSTFLLQVVFALSSLILLKAQDVIGPGHSCLRWRLDNHGQTRVTFLREEETPGAHSLYLSLWSEDMRLVTCEINTNPIIVDRYRALCGRSGTQGQKNAQKFNISALMAPGGHCARNASGAPNFARRANTDERTEGKARRKRAWILPGTLWCGRGSEAVRYEQLGMFENTDKCCREHDHCLNIIPPFRVNYGVFNPNFYTVSHCECDQRFRHCLLSVNDTISSMVGYSFFNILRVPCFELKQKRRCTEMYWWGMCKVAKEAPYAVFKRSLPFNTSDTISNVTSGDKNDMDKSSEGQHVTERPVTNPQRRSPKSEHRCGSRDPPRGDTFRHRRTKGRACKRQSAVEPSQMPTISRSQATTPSIKMGLLNVSRSLTTNKKRVGKLRSTKKSLSLHPTRSQVPPQATNFYPQATSTTKSTPSPTQKPTHQPHLLTTITAVTKTTETRKKVPKNSRCCTSRMPLRDDTFRPRCKSCLRQETISHMATVTPTTTMNALHVNVTTLWTMRQKKTTEPPKQDTLWNATIFSTPIANKQTSAASFHKNGKPQKQMDSYLLQDNISQRPMGGTLAQSSLAERSLEQNNLLRNMTDNHFICGSLKHLDGCKYRIPPMEKKYDLQNMESKTAYHCDCTSRLAVQFESFNQLSILPTLLKNFVSQYCFNLPKEKKCHSRKSCSGGFTIASDLLRTLKKIEVTGTAGVQNSGNDKKRGFPVRLYKRCLRLEREAVHMNID